jgi:tetratricopeptide (TPR) repeat protein
VTSDRRWALGLAGGAALAVVPLLTIGMGDDGGGGPSAAATTSTTRDLSSVPNDELERVVAEHPGVVPMRLALVERYLRDGQLEEAQRHAEEAAVRAADIPDRARALRYLGWTTALLGQAETGEGLLVQSLALEPADPDGLYFLGRVRFELLDRPDLAIEPLEQLENIEMTDEQRQLVDALLNEVRVSLAAQQSG